MAETKSKKPGIQTTGGLGRFFGGVRDVGLDHAREAWADIGNVYQNVLWSNSGIGAPNQPHSQLGPAALQSLTMSVDVEMKFGPGLKEPHVTVRKGATVHETRVGPSSTGQTPHAKATPPSPAAPDKDGPDSTINKVGPPAAASPAAPSAESKAGTVGLPKSVEPPTVKPDTPEPEYNGPEIGL